MSHTQAYYEGWELLGRSFNLVHYMLSTEENRDRMVQYLHRVNEGADQALAFADMFGLSGRGRPPSIWPNWP